MATIKNRLSPLIFAAAACALFAFGCQEPNYRNEVSTNAQGAVEVHRVAKDAPPHEPAANPTARTDPTTEQRLAALEAQVLELRAEVSRLNSGKLQKPATSP
ncbi:MAG TPA: hypothetical protein VFE47_07450 [Tepidisphaeraceae bacterium]|jgi:hypothetical protein|nr:hypothetical protein [Tepidisphaeraceae bacterium]